MSQRIFSEEKIEGLLLEDQKDISFLGDQKVMTNRSTQRTLADRLLENLQKADGRLEADREFSPKVPESHLLED